MKTHTKEKPIQDSDPADGLKAVGCLFAGVIILIVILSFAGWFIHQLRSIS